jgi:hypothetical protein
LQWDEILKQIFFHIFKRFFSITSLCSLLVIRRSHDANQEDDPPIQLYVQSPIGKTIKSQNLKTSDHFDLTDKSYIYLQSTLFQLILQLFDCVSI